MSFGGQSTRWFRRVGLGTVVAVVTVMSMPGAASAAPADGVYPSWTITPASTSAQNHSGNITFGVTGMPDATYTVTKTQNDGQSTALRTAANGDWLTTDTPFGAVFGASNNPATIQYLSTRIDYNGFPPNGSVATTEITFATPVPANALGFAVGDVDVDVVGIDATDANSAALTGAQLNGSAFNFCDVAMDIPTNCAGVVAPFDLPTWNAATRQVIGTNDEETEGASAWFRPTTTVKTLSFEFSGQTGSGSPSYRLWIAVLTANVRGTVDFGTCSTTGVDVALIDPDGSTVLDVITTDGSGNYEFPGYVVAQPGYTVAINPPDGCSPVGPAEKPADTSTQDADVDFTLEETPAVTTTSTAPSGPIIADTGAGTAVEAIVGSTFVLLGGLFMTLARRRPVRES